MSQSVCAALSALVADSRLADRHLKHFSDAGTEVAASLDTPSFLDVSLACAIHYSISFVNHFYIYIVSVFEIFSVSVSVRVLLIAIISV